MQIRKYKYSLFADLSRFLFLIRKNTRIEGNNTMKQEGKQEKELLCQIVDRQIAVRREVYDNVLRHMLCECDEDSSLYTNCIANFYHYCEYAKKNGGWVAFFKELDYLENCCLAEQLFYGDCFELHRDCDFINFGIPVFTVYPLLREAVLNMVSCEMLAEIWITTYTEDEKVKITILHDIPEECLKNADFRASNTYGFSLVQKRIEQYGGSLKRSATVNGLMENILIIPFMTVKSIEPMFLWYR